MKVLYVDKNMKDENKIPYKQELYSIVSDLKNQGMKTNSDVTYSLLKSIAGTPNYFNAKTFFLLAFSNVGKTRFLSDLTGHKSITIREMANYSTNSNMDSGESSRRFNITAPFSFKLANSLTRDEFFGIIKTGLANGRNPFTEFGTKLFNNAPIMHEELHYARGDDDNKISCSYTYKSLKFLEHKLHLEQALRNQLKEQLVLRSRYGLVEAIAIAKEAVEATLTKPMVLSCFKNLVKSNLAYVDEVEAKMWLTKYINGLEDEKQQELVNQINLVTDMRVKIEQLAGDENCESYTLLSALAIAGYDFPVNATTVVEFINIPSLADLATKDAIISAFESVNLKDLYNWAVKVHERIVWGGSIASKESTHEIKRIKACLNLMDDKHEFDSNKTVEDKSLADSSESGGDDIFGLDSDSIINFESGVSKIWTDHDGLQLLELLLRVAIKSRLNDTKPVELDNLIKENFNNILALDSLSFMLMSNLKLPSTPLLNELINSTLSDRALLPLIDSLNKSFDYEEQSVNNQPAMRYGLSATIETMTYNMAFAFSQSDFLTIFSLNPTARDLNEEGKLLPMISEIVHTQTRNVLILDRITVDESWAPSEIGINNDRYTVTIAYSIEEARHAGLLKSSKDTIGRFIWKQWQAKHFLSEKENKVRIQRN